MKKEFSIDAAVRHLKKSDPVLAKVISRLPKPDIKPRKNHFRSLVRSVISQQLSTKAADTIAKRFIALFPGKTFPAPSDVLAAADKSLRSAGLSGSKAKYIKEIARAFADKQVRPRKFNALTDEEIIVELVKIKGVGRWTAEMFLMFSLARADVFSHGDLGLRKAVEKLYGFKRPPTQKQIEIITSQWSPHRTTASRYLWLSLDSGLSGNGSKNR